MSDRLRAVAAYLLNRMSEASTWQGLGFIATLLGARWAASLDWGAAAALGGLVSGAIKTLLPDSFTKGGGQ